MFCRKLFSMQFTFRGSVCKNRLWDECWVYRTLYRQLLVYLFRQKLFLCILHNKEINVRIIYEMTFGYSHITK